MPLTINLVLFKRKQCKDGTIPIYVRITQNQKSKCKSTGVAVLPQHWHAKDQLIRRTHKDYKKLNRKLRKFRREFEEKRDELEIQGQLDIDILKNAVVKDSNPNDLITRSEAYHDSLNESYFFCQVAPHVASGGKTGKSFTRAISYTGISTYFKQN